MEEGKVRILNAKLHDHYCDFGFEIIEGTAAGMTGNLKGKGKVIKEDLLNAFVSLNVHLAALDDGFKAIGVESEQATDLTGHEVTGKYNVTAIKVKGEEEDLQVMLIGDKYISGAIGRASLEIPFVALDNPSYKYATELKSALQVLRDEVVEYKNGKFDVEEEEVVEEEIENQLDLLNEGKNDKIIEKSKGKRGKKAEKTEEDPEIQQ